MEQKQVKPLTETIATVLPAYGTRKFINDIQASPPKLKKFP